MTEFSNRYDRDIVLAYYPPYHSQYNPIERGWGILEKHWDGTLLKRVETALAWAKSMTWKGRYPTVELVKTSYEKGVKVAKEVFQTIADRIIRHPSLPKYCVTIQPQRG